MRPSTIMMAASRTGLPPLPSIRVRCCKTVVSAARGIAARRNRTDLVLIVSAIVTQRAGVLYGYGAALSNAKPKSMTVEEQFAEIRALLKTLAVTTVYHD